MKKWLGMVAAAALLSAGGARAQAPVLKNAKSWQLSGRVQVQYLYNADIAGDAGVTNNGFRIRRGRLQAKAKLSPFISAKFQIEVRDNSPRLKDAEGVVALGSGYALKFGQFKVPVWREELRSSGSLFLVERSIAAEFLADYHLSARSIGVELAKKLSNGGEVRVNLSNGAGEGGREDAGRTKFGLFVNNGKLLTARLELPVSETLRLGLSGALNRVGQKTPAADTRGSITAVAPDFGLYLDAGERAKVEIEGGLAFVRFPASVAAPGDRNVTLLDVTGRWRKKLAKVRTDLAGVEAVGIAVGYSLVDQTRSVSSFRFGPEVWFQGHTRLQLNAEIEDGDGSQFRIRGQWTVNF